MQRCKQCEETLLGAACMTCRAGAKVDHRVRRTWSQLCMALAHQHLQQRRDRQVMASRAHWRESSRAGADKCKASRRTCIEAAEQELAGGDQQALRQREAVQHQPKLDQQRRVQQQAHGDECRPVQPARSGRPVSSGGAKQHKVRGTKPAVLQSACDGSGLSTRNREALRVTTVVHAGAKLDAGGLLGRASA